MVHEVDRLVDLQVLGEIVVQKEKSVSAQVLDVLERAGVQVVHAEDAEALRDEVVTEMRAEKAGPTGHDSGGHRRDATRLPRTGRKTLRGLYRGLSRVTFTRWRRAGTSISS